MLTWELSFLYLIWTLISQWFLLSVIKYISQCCKAIKVIYHFFSYFGVFSQNWRNNSKSINTRLKLHELFLFHVTYNFAISVKTLENGSFSLWRLENIHLTTCSKSMVNLLLFIWMWKKWIYTVESVYYGSAYIFFSM